MLGITIFQWTVCKCETLLRHKTKSYVSLLLWISKNAHFTILIFLLSCCLFLKIDIIYSNFETFYVTKKNWVWNLIIFSVDMNNSLSTFFLNCRQILKAFLCLFICLSACLSDDLSVFLCICLSISLPVCLSDCLSVYLSCKS